MRTKAALRLFPFSCLLLPPPSSPFPLHEFPQLLPPILVELDFFLCPALCGVWRREA